MRTNLRRRALMGLAATLLLACAARAQQTAPPRRPSGPIAGPIITLPAGQGETLAEPNERRRADDSAGRAGHAPARWEYCAITSVNRVQKDRWSPVVSIAYVSYFGAAERGQFEGATDNEAIANALSSLGDEGWELVAIRESFNISEGTGASYASFYFKRPKTAPRQPAQP